MREQERRDHVSRYHSEAPLWELLPSSWRVCLELLGPGKAFTFPNSVSPAEVDKCLGSFFKEGIFFVTQDLACTCRASCTHFAHSLSITPHFPTHTPAPAYLGFTPQAGVCRKAGSPAMWPARSPLYCGEALTPPALLSGSHMHVCMIRSQQGKGVGSEVEYGQSCYTGHLWARDTRCPASWRKHETHEPFSHCKDECRSSVGPKAMDPM